MEYKEYMDTLREQIRDKHARELVSQEISGHIEEQAWYYEMEGMSREAARNEAVRQMGDPVETGSELNKIHRPVFPWKMLILAVGLTLASIVMQWVIVSQLDNGVNEMQQWITFSQIHADANQIQQLLGILFANGIGFAIIFLILYSDYTVLVRNIRFFYGGHLLLLTFCGLLGCRVISYETAFVISYDSFFLLPVLFAGLIYQNRNQGVRGILKSVFSIVIPYAVLILLFGIFDGYQVVSGAALAENLLILFLMLVFAAGRGIFGREKKKHVFFVAGTGAAAVLCVIGFLMTGDGLPRYWSDRLLAALPGAGTEHDYLSGSIREAFAGLTLTGTESFVPGTVNHGSYEGIYLLGNMFSYFGIIVGAAVLVALILFLFYAFRVSLRQSNRMGFLIGTACCSGILVRLLAYLGINFGYALWYTTSIPFLGYDLMNIVMNSIYVGLIFSVARNTMTIGERRERKEEKGFYAIY